MELSGSAERSIVEWLSTVLGDDSNVGPIDQVSEALGRMFQSLLGESPTWSSYWWVDDALPQRATRVDDTTVEITGIFLPSDEKHRWIQPFAAMFRTDSGGSRIVGYRVSLGDADVKIDAVSWGAKTPSGWPHVTRWAYTFLDPEETPEPSDIRDH